MGVSPNEGTLHAYSTLGMEIASDQLCHGPGYRDLPPLCRLSCLDEQVFAADLVCCTEVRGVRYDAKVKACSQTLVRIRPDVGVPEAGWQPYWFRAYASQM
jgi:hypothetical protein